MSHLEVAQYVAHERPDLSRAWLHLLAFIQGMYPQHRITSIHIEEENEDWVSAFSLEAQMASIHPLFVTGASSLGDNYWGVKKAIDGSSNVNVVSSSHGSLRTGHDYSGNITDDEARLFSRDSETEGHADQDWTTNKITLEHFPVANLGRNDPNVVSIAGVLLPTAFVWFLSECFQVIDAWFALDASREAAKTGGQTLEFGQGSSKRRGVHLRGRVGRGITRNAFATTFAEGSPARGSTIRDWLHRGRRATAVDLRSVHEELMEEGGFRRSSVASEAELQDSSDMDVDAGLVSDLSEAGNILENGWTDWWMGSDAGKTGSGLGMFNGEENWPSIEFDVSRQDVSFHIPLHRILALLLHKALELYVVNRKSPENGATSTEGTDNVSLDNVNFLLQLLPARFQVPAFAALLMEHPLRLQVLCAQVQAGMWRRNGHSIVGLCNIYHAVQWCENSLELDLFLLQCCAAMAPPEEFVERVLSRFGLADYFSLFLWQPNEYETTLAQGLLVLCIQVVSERGFCGLSMEESLRRELVQRLAIGDAAHSSLVKALPPRMQDNNHLQKTLDAIAIYLKPSGMQQGKYSLKEDCWRELDLYHPRWTPRELQAAEERYLRVCKTSALFAQLPQWRMPFPPLQNLANIAISGRMHDILRSVFFHAAFSINSSESRAPENLLFTALHMLSLGLDICSMAPYKQDRTSKEECILRSYEHVQPELLAPYSNYTQEYPSLLARAVERVLVGGADGTVKPERQSLLSLLIMLMRKYRLAELGEKSNSDYYECNVGAFIRSLLQRFAELHRGCMYEIESLAPEILHRLSTVSVKEKNENIILEDNEQPDRCSDADKRKLLARQRQAAMLAKMKAAQDQFVASLEPLEQNTEQKRGRLDIEKPEGKRPRELMDVHEFENRDSVSPVCALCRDSGSTNPLCILTLVQRSRLLALSENPTPSWEAAKKGFETLALAEREVSNVSSTVRRDAENLISELRQWIQGAVGDATALEQTDREDLFELFRNELPSIIRNAGRVSSPAGTMGVRSLDHAETEFDGGSPSNEEVDNNTETSLSPLLDSSWWAENLSAVNLNESTVGRENAIATVLSEYVATVSRGQAESQRNAGTETLREINATRSRRASARSTLPVLGSELRYNFGMNDSLGLNLSACGHSVHQECLDRYFSSLLQRYYSRSLFEGVQIVDPDMGEFLCPVCRRLANSILPVIPSSSSDALERLPGPTYDASSSSVSRQHSSHLEVSLACQTINSFQLEQAFQLLQNAEELMCKPGFRKAVFVKLPDAIKGVLEALAVRLCGLFYPDKDHFSTLVQGRDHQSLLLWDVFRYSLMSAELAARTKSLMTGLNDTGNRLLFLGEAADPSRGSVLPMLYCAAKVTQSQSRQAVLLRARGMQLLVGSICSGISRDLLPGKNFKASISSLLQYLEKGHNCADVQFWTRAADPVLVHDPFSSLLWLLFCLPLPLPSYGAPFIALVHLFYLICITQIIACAGKFQTINYGLTTRAHTFVSAIQATTSETVLAKLFQDDLDFSMLSRNPLIHIRQLTLPFLRRCSLLQNVCSIHTSVVPIAGSQSWDILKQSGYMSELPETKRLSNTEFAEVLVELNELEELEKLFSIPPIQNVLEDEALQNVVLRWCTHLQNETGSRHFRHVPRPTTAAPFQMMHLPYLFQDLLQRYIKECCPQCNTVPERPALCLLCGALCCGSGPRGCCSENMQSECYRHAGVCGAGIGVFLMLRRTNVLLMRWERQTMWPSPYLDAFGEEDLEMRRGKPLYLSEERYAVLTAMVASHGLDYSSYVLLHTTRDVIF
ncbi:hypothetical protein O6H91_22G030900 [Diphasiastrum complanatum]|nr:hypothetical protein O6H91_22G030900 [Diphasiastrum complanatum]